MASDRWPHLTGAGAGCPGRGRRGAHGVGGGRDPGGARTLRPPVRATRCAAGEASAAAAVSRQSGRARGARGVCRYAARCLSADLTVAAEAVEGDGVLVDLEAGALLQCGAQRRNHTAVDVFYQATARADQVMVVARRTID